MVLSTYLATVGPVWAEEPEGRPDAADRAWHVCNVRDEEAMGVTFVATDSDGCPTCGRVHGGVVDTEIDLAVVCVDQTLACSGGLGLVGDVAVCRVSAGVEAEV